MLVLCGFGIFASIGASAQINDGSGHSMQLLQTKKNENMNSIQGSPYLHDDFRFGTVTLDGKETLEVFLRYDVLNENMEIKTDKSDDKIFVLPLAKKAGYQIGADAFEFRSIIHEGKKIKGYFRQHHQGGNVSLLEKLSASLTEPVKAKTGYDKDKPAQIVIKEEYYLLFNDGSAKNVRLKEKDFKKALPASKAVNAYVSDHKVRSVDDFAKMLQWYNDQLQ